MFHYSFAEFIHVASFASRQSIVTDLTDTKLNIRNVRLVAAIQTSSFKYSIYFPGPPREYNESLHATNGEITERSIQRFHRNTR